MSDKYCLECGSRLPDLETGGLCPVCALRGALINGIEPEQPEANSREGQSNAASGLLASGHKFGDYEILEEIARGGMGIVYRARQISLDRVVAIKMLLPGLLSSEYVRRFRTEASAAAGLQHPNIVAIHEVGAWQDQPYLVMDYVEGSSLTQWITKSDHALPHFREAARLLKAVAEAVQYSHENGILHRDLKPSNVLVDKLGQPRVTDFGLAKHFEGESGITLSGQVIGSPNYMSPEQSAGGRAKVSPRSDVYCLGATLYHLLTRRAPFQGDTPAEVMHQVLTREPVKPRLLDPDIPRDLETICLKCLEKEPARRYASARMVAEELSRFLDDRPILARPVRMPERIWRWGRRKPLVAGLAVVLAVSLMLALWFGRQAHLSSQLAEREQRQRAVDTALAAAWAGDRSSFEKAIKEVERHGGADEWIPMLRGQFDLYTPQTEEAVKQFERAVTLAPRNVAARAMLATAYLYNGQATQYFEKMGSLETFSPKTPEDYLFLGVALVAGHPDTAKAVSLLEYAKQKRPSGVAVIQLALAEGFHAADVGSWPIARKALDHCQMGADFLGADHPLVLCVRLNACNFGLRLCPDSERAGIRAMAAETAHTLDSAFFPVAHMQRAFYFQIVGDEAAELRAWHRIVQQGGGELFASYYAAAMLGRDKSGEGIEVLDQLGLPPDSLMAISKAFLLLDNKHPEEARELYLRAATNERLRMIAETILLLAGDSNRVVAESAQLLEKIPPQHPDYQALQFYTGLISAEELAISAGPSRVQACGDYYLAAMLFLSRGEREAARQYFRRSVETGTHWWIGHQWSRAFLARLERDPHWPPWIPSR
jgi:tetratricopeptide (TPR) repeat protein